MEVKLWNELNDQQAEKASGGAGIGEAVSTQNEISREIGFQNSNQLARALGYKNYGEAVSAFAQAVNGPQ